MIIIMSKPNYDVEFGHVRDLMQFLPADKRSQFNLFLQKTITVVNQLDELCLLLPESNVRDTSVENIRIAQKSIVDNCVSLMLADETILARVNLTYKLLSLIKKE